MEFGHYLVAAPAGVILECFIYLDVAMVIDAGEGESKRALAKSKENFLPTSPGLSCAFLLWPIA